MAACCRESSLSSITMSASPAIRPSTKLGSFASECVAMIVSLPLRRICRQTSCRSGIVAHRGAEYFSVIARPAAAARARELAHARTAGYTADHSLGQGVPLSGPSQGQQKGVAARAGAPGGLHEPAGAQFAHQPPLPRPPEPHGRGRRGLRAAARPAKEVQGEGRGRDAPVRSGLGEAHRGQQPGPQPRGRKVDVRHRVQADQGPAAVPPVQPHRGARHDYAGAARLRGDAQPLRHGAPPPAD
eukprot:7383827-Prymnesium_polylepis.1